MYVCLDCQKTFETPKYWMDRHGLDSPPYETWRGCPYCGGWSYINTIICDCCGEEVGESYIKTADNRIYCEECYVIYELGEE